MYPYPSLARCFSDRNGEPLWIGLDPGTTKTGWVVFDPKEEKVLHAGHDPNEFVIHLLGCADADLKDKVIMECFAAQGMPLGESSIETVRWEGRFIERARRMADLQSQVPQQVQHRLDDLLAPGGFPAAD